MKNKKYMIIGLILLAVTGALQLAARQIPGFGQWYAVTIYPWIVGSVGRICGIFPFSVVEVVIYLLIIGSVVYGIRHIREIPRLLTRMFVMLAVLTFLYTANCGINYYRRPFSDYLALETGHVSQDELLGLCQFLTDRVNETAGDMVYNQGWKQEGRQAMAALGGTYPELAGYYPTPKPLMVPWLLSVQQLSGIYMPFTVEANYNREMTAYNIPLTICHELSHLRGFMREDEANFIGYLACVESENREFQYSGYLMGWIYASNALAKQDAEAYWELYGRLDESVILQLQENARFWDQYEGKVAEVSTQMNDTYLKINSQEDGVQSYGRMVDLMLAYYRNQ